MLRIAIVMALASGALAQEQDEIRPLIDAGNVAYMRGDYETARQSFVSAWDLAQKKAPSDPIRYDVLKRLTSVRLAVSEFADADNYLQMAINWRELAFGQNDPKVAEDLLVSVGLCRGMKNYDRASLVLTRVMGIHRAAYGEDSREVADDFSRMAQIFSEQKKPQNAIGMLKVAIEMRTKLAGPLDPSMVPDLDRMAGLFIMQRTYDKAEEAYRHALVIRETLYGKEDADLIATVDGLAYAVFGQKKYDEAEPLYQRLLSLWIKSLGEEHPMVALALEKISVFYAEQKRFDLAKDAEDRALAIRTHFLATGLSGAATEQTAEGNQTEALALYHRALTVMDPMHPLYAKLRTDIEGIVSGMEGPLPKPAPSKKGPPASKAMPGQAAPKKK